MGTQRGQEGQCSFSRANGVTTYEVAFAWAAIPDLKNRVAVLTDANAATAINLAWKVQTGAAADAGKVWPIECGNYEEGIYSFVPYWFDGPRINTRWTMINGNGSMVQYVDAAPKSGTAARRLGIRAETAGRTPGLVCNVPARGRLSLVLYSLDGKQVAAPIDRECQKGTCTIPLPQAHAGMQYVVRASCNGETQTGKILITR
jgi:hypothetical protein